MNSNEARNALAHVSSAQARMAAVVADCPPWRHALFGALLFVLIGSTAISSTIQFATAPFILLAVYLIVRSDRVRMGVFVNGYRRGATLPLSLAMLAVMAGLVFGAMELRVGGYGLGAKLALAAAAFGIATWFSVYWQRIYLLELKAGAE